jgi:hypothetical protein
LFIFVELSYFFFYATFGTCLFHNITNISKKFEITKFPGKIFGVRVFYQKRVLVLTSEKTWKIIGPYHPPYFTRKGAGGEEGYPDP